MTCHTKEDLENMLFDVVNELDLSDGMISRHGPLGTPPAILVREVLIDLGARIRMLRELLEAQTAYTISLQRAIEAHCRNEIVDDAKCRHHAEKLNANLALEEQK